MIIGAFLQSLSSALALVERGLLRLLVGVIAGCVLLNVGLRAFRITVAWADELALHAMILSGFVGASLMLRARVDPAMLLAHQLVSDRVGRALRLAVSALSAAFGMVLFWLCLRWFDPLGLARAGFDVAAFEAERFNFIYTDTTPVMAVPSYWFYLVMPWVALTLSVHGLANMAEDAGLARRAADPAGLGLKEGPL